MKSPIFVIVSLLVFAGVVWASYSFLQSSSPSANHKTYKIGIIVRGDSYKPAVSGFKAHMAELGYVEGSSVSYDTQYVVSAGDIASTTAGVIARKPDLILTFSTPVTAEAAKETKTIPIVFGSVGDPLGAHFVTSLSRPGGNLTGIMSLSVELSAKRLDLLKQLYPNLKRVAVPATMTDVAAKNSFDLIVKTAPTLGVTVVPYIIDANHTPTEVAGTISHKDVDGIVLTADSATWAVLPAYIAQAKKEKLPFAVFDQNMVQSGGLVGYGPEYTSLGGQAADMVKRILDGTSPAVVPVESPEKLILALNLKTAKDLGLVVPDVFLSQVDYLVK